MQNSFCDFNLTCDGVVMGANIEPHATYVTHIMNDVCKEKKKKKNPTEVKVSLRFHATNGKEGSACTHEQSNFFSFREAGKEGGGLGEKKKERYLFIGFSQCVPIMFSMSSQILKRGFPSFQSVFKCIHSPQDFYF
jgi:hypothetical protein